ncbi:hypothetical protein [Luteimonas sp. FCS-9]|uniref:hypothetical protein n=1 Tax=Luteimonas sp. FCS-9 TaxID=1547516 RepID=UPI000A91F2E4|nr:hypothetical protein [Luteimonas sp. FCS-9]
MPLWMLIVGCVVLVGLVGFQFMLTVFVGGALANRADPTPFQMSLLDLSIWGLPGLTLVVLGVLIALYVAKSPWLSVWWFAVPVVATAVFAGWAMSVAG